MPERRSVTRTKIDAHGRIFVRDADQILNCTVHDITDNGFGLEIAESAPLRSEFDFSFDGFRTIRHCHLIWRRHGVAGALFRKKA
jgi:hypothetical protein